MRKLYLILMVSFYISNVRKIFFACLVAYLTLPALSQEEVPVSFGEQLVDAEPEELEKNQAPSSFWNWFPPCQAPLEKLIAQIDLFGDKTLNSNALFEDAPISLGAQYIKSEASEIGLYYVLHTAYSMGSVHNHVTGYEAFEQFFTSNFLIRWNILSGPDRVGTWINAGFDTMYGLGRKNPDNKGIIYASGSNSNPNNSVLSKEGVYLTEIVLTQSFWRGSTVIIAGMLNDTNYMDTNLYGGTSFGLFMNSGFCNSMVLPVVSSNLGLLLQRQFENDLYVMLKAGTTHSGLGTNPLHGINSDSMSYIAEIGWIADNALGIGYGAYKLQPFLATVGGTTQPGVGLNFSQDFGKSPFALFGRMGTAGNKVSRMRGTQTQIAGGLVIKRPLQAMRLVEEDSSNFLGIACNWNRVSHDIPDVHGREETALEINYSIQVTPTMIVQPNYQMIFNPAYNDRHSFASVFQIQVSWNW